MEDLDQKKIHDVPKVEDAKEVSHSTDDDDQKPIYNKFQVADVVKRERQKALEKGRQMALDELNAMNNTASVTNGQMNQSPPQPSNNMPASPAAPSQNFGGMPQLSPEEIKRMVAENIQQQIHSHAQQQHAQNQAEGFVRKMVAAESKHPGLEAKLNKLDWTHMGPVVRLIDSTSNPADIMKELLDHPQKMAHIVTLAHTQPYIANEAVQELSKSIIQNEIAKAQEKETSEPLGLITPSNVGSDTGSSSSIRDFKKKYRA